MKERLEMDNIQLLEQFKPHTIDENCCKLRNCNKCDKYRKEIEEYRKIGTVAECRENKKFLEFLYDVINPNEMEKYISMCHAGNEKSDWSDTE